LALVEAEKNSFDAFNFGPSEPSLSVKEVISIATNSWGAELSLEIAESNPDIEARSLELDSSLANSCLGWKPYLNQTEAIEQTVNWWKRNKLHGVSASDLCNEEISQALNSYK
jgi:CDP-glucose 4,6-dehydratase